MTELMRVAWVCTELPPAVLGGLGRYVERILPPLRRSGAAVVAVGFGSSDRQRLPDGTRARLYGRRVEDRHGTARAADLVAFTFRATMRLARSSAGRRGSVIAVHDWSSAGVGLLLATIGRRVVFHIHTSEATTTVTGQRPIVGRIIRLLEDLLSRRARAIVVPSTRMRAQLVSRGWLEEKIAVIPHGVRSPTLDDFLSQPVEQRLEIRDRVRRTLGVNGPMVLFVGRLAEHKGAGTLVAAAPELLSRHPDATIVIVGRGSAHGTETETFERALTRSPSSTSIVWIDDFLDEAAVYEHFLAADVCVFPSRYEPFGLAAVEAIALGVCTVLGTGFSDEVAAAGHRVLDDTPGSLASMIGSLLVSPSPQTAADVALQRFDWEHAAERTVELYRRASR
ncbi:glycosyltransferase family 4 protein [Microbacterium sp. NPDC087665]|uniref:glycosyltransferase family 4 protein n=1 Tax=Microbacterium sp. NPDC087665 TaxID=3364194 RepID=UPI0037F9B2CB